MIKAILLDIDDTILDWSLCSHDSMMKAAEELNIKLPDNFFSIFDRINPTIWHRLEKKEIDFDYLIKNRFRIIFEEANVIGNPNQFESTFRKYLLDSAIMVEGTKEILEYLYSKYYIFATTNSTLYQQLRRLSKDGLIDYFNDLLVSEEIGHSKPTKEYYDGVFKRIGFKKEEVIAIGDSLTSDIKGAIDYGIPCIWFNKHKKDLVSDATYQVDDLLKIKEIL